MFGNPGSIPDTVSALHSGHVLKIFSAQGPAVCSSAHPPHTDVRSTSAACHWETFRAQTLPHAKPPMAHTWMDVAKGCSRNDLLALLSDQELPEPLDPVSSPDGNLLLPVASNVGSNPLGRPFAASIDRLSPRRISWNSFFDVSYKATCGRRACAHRRSIGFGRGGSRVRPNRANHAWEQA